MMNKLLAKDPLKVYWKKHGSIEKCLKEPGTASVMKLDGDYVTFNDKVAITEAHTKGIISDNTFAIYYQE